MSCDARSTGWKMRSTSLGRAPSASGPVFAWHAETPITTTWAWPFLRRGCLAGQSQRMATATAMVLHDSGGREAGNESSDLFLKERGDEFLRLSPRPPSCPSIALHASARGDVVKEDALKLTRQVTIENAHVGFFIVRE
jgi:hypothetical protein